MRYINHFDAEPLPVEEIVRDGRKHVYIRQNIEKHTVTDEHGERDEWTATEYHVELSSLAQVTDLLIAKIIQQDYEDTCKAVRAKRDELLKATDASMAFDRLGLVVPSGSSFTAWLSFLRGLGETLLGEMAKYRQALRDLPQQEGFPYDVEFPIKPKD